MDLKKGDLVFIEYSSFQSQRKDQTLNRKKGAGLVILMDGPYAIVYWNKPKPIRFRGFRKRPSSLNIEDQKEKCEVGRLWKVIENDGDKHVLAQVSWDGEILETTQVLE